MVVTALALHEFCRAALNCARVKLVPMVPPAKRDVALVAMVFVLKPVLLEEGTPKTTLMKVSGSVLKASLFMLTLRVMSVIVGFSDVPYVVQRFDEYVHAVSVMLSVTMATSVHPGDPKSMDMSQYTGPEGR